MQSIRHLGNKFKWLVTDERVFFVLVLVFIAIAAYGLGRLSVTGVPFTLFEESPSASDVQLLTSTTATDDRLIILEDEVTESTVIGSRNGARYYTPDCTGVERIAKENRLYFVDRKRARAAGYTASTRCFD